MTDNDTTRARTPAEKDQPAHVRSALESVRAAHEKMDDARAAAKRAAVERERVLRDLWPVIRHMGPRGVMRATGIGESTVRSITRHLEGDNRG